MWSDHLKSVDIDELTMDRILHSSLKLVLWRSGKESNFELDIDYDEDVIKAVRRRDQVDVFKTFDKKMANLFVDTFRLLLRKEKENKNISYAFYAYAINEDETGFSKLLKHLKTPEELEYERLMKEDYDVSDKGSYCGSCQNRPCVCSDPDPG